MKFLSNLFKKKIGSVEDILSHPDGKRYYRDAHLIRKNMIDEDAVKIIHRLNKFGFKAYIVGGGVRDLLLGRKPKDFDVVTNATPNQIKKIFNNCRIIGRRFKIVHILFRGKVIEVSTFRSLPDYRLGKAVEDQDYLIKRDNKFGTPQEDAARRDFTINSLYYDVRNDSIIDYVGGFEDIRNKVLRVIGDPDISFREDPVRMLRAVKFAEILGLNIEKTTSKAIRKHKAELEKASSSRMLEEYNKIFRTWKTSLIFQGMAEHGLLEVLFKEAFEKERKRNSNFGEKFLETNIGKRLAIADKLLTEREEMTPHIFYSLIFSDLASEALQKENMHLVPAIKNSLEPIFNRLETPKKDKDRLIKIFASQQRFLSTEDEKSSQNNFFRMKDYFYDAFMVFKIGAIAENDEKAIQSAFFWEISVRKRPIPVKRFNGGGGGSRSNKNRNKNFQKNREERPNRREENQNSESENQSRRNQNEDDSGENYSAENPGNEF
ncbi:poly(A) polymerase [Leptospira weilii str. 2006001853]|uniref:Poly(A) polymerase I n=2 Tax=Leptospira weilii TaxID=28184 RepID=A0A828ZA82_9LEPT|nr:polynucleotide adenylyltransferase PcnB [Leptospira weilii]EKR66332.1 poly(A) polymerase [Leptospira weilii str. 2006001853]EMN43429.1 poly(A) polymerase [Leptospira weilii str. LNT 1234]EMN88146.1 poly(A) polymerase [Leptospira weilii str. UI 13098]MDL5246926.1 polynucleotide adenylyltransferase PcnB [Leptospira weilii]OMI17249.1 tRNA nucleotidyltransferase [Leptospira weilii serovar Heyan]